MKINSCLALALLLLLVSCALAVETTTQEANGAGDKVEPTYQGGGGCWGGHCGGGGGGCRGRHCGGGGGCRGRHCGGGGGCRGRHCGGGGGGYNKCGSYGCCEYYGGSCRQCCYSAAEAQAFAEKQAYP